MKHSAFSIVLFSLLSLCSAQNASTIYDLIEATTTCAGCSALLLALKGVAALGNDAFVSVITGVCILSGAEDPDVCAGAIGLEGPILAHDLRGMTIPSYTSTWFCTTIFGLCPLQAVRPYSVSFPTAKPAKTRPAPSGQSPIQIVHFSDIHVDLSYTVGANYNCTKNICCRPYTASDAPGKTQYPAGPNGNHQCDSPKTLEQSLYAAIGQVAPNATFALFTGDVVEGAVWLVNQAEVTGDLNDAYATMASKLGMPVFAATGNHDAAPVNSFPPNNIDTTISSQYVYDTLSAKWQKWIGSSAAGQADKYGAYSYKLPNYNLKVISVNTNFYYKQNFWLYEKTIQYDPDGQLAWLVSELQAAETAGQRAIIIGHMPFGVNDAFRDGSNYLGQILNRYDATIAGLFFGHTHKDDFQIGYSSYSVQSARTANSISHIAPALTPTSGSPAFKVYTVDPVTFGVLDVTVYSTSLEAATYQTSPVWTKYYSAKEAYGPLVSPPVTAASAELTPAFWHNLTAVFQSNDAVFQQYNARKSRGWNVPSCDAACKAKSVCQLKAAEAQYNCASVSAGINFKRDTSAVAEVDGPSECHGSKMMEVLSRMNKGSL
ncbi:hypothetical protein LTR95_013926 [Oleoguttula sp. CCFEE 5521]